jgi:hypothetical protein
MRALEGQRIAGHVRAQLNGYPPLIAVSGCCHVALAKLALDNDLTFDIRPVHRSEPRERDQYG